MMSTKREGKAYLFCPPVTDPITLHFPCIPEYAIDAKKKQCYVGGNSLRMAEMQSELQ